MKVLPDVLRDLGGSDGVKRIHRAGAAGTGKSERGRWICTTCGGTIDVHHYRCPVWGKEPE